MGETEEDKEKGRKILCCSTSSGPIGGTAWSAWFNYLKGMMGAGLLAIPHGFADSGLVLGIVGFLVVGLICAFSVYCIVEVAKAAKATSSHTRTTKIVNLTKEQETNLLGEEKSPVRTEESERGHGGESDGEDSSVRERIHAAKKEEEAIALADSSTSDEETESTYVTCRDLQRRCVSSYGKARRALGVIFLELLFCTGFLIAICENISAMIPRLNELGIWGYAVTTAVLMPVLILLSWIEKVKDMWFLSVFVYVFGVIGATFIYGGLQPGPATEPKELAVWTTFPLFIGTASYALEGINLALPIVNAMDEPEKAHTVFFTGTMFYAILIAAYGAFGYMRGYGGCDIITTCLPEGIALKIIRVALCLSLTATHTITLFPATEMMENLLIKPDTKFKTWKKRIISSCLVLVTGIATVGIGKNFGIFSSLVGALMISMIGFIIPVVLYVKLFKKTMSLPMWLCCSFTIMIGLSSMGTGTYESIMKLVNKH